MQTTTGNDSLLLVSKRTDEFNKLNQHSAANRDLITTLNNKRYNKIDDIVGKNDAINIAEIFEENEQIVNRIYLKTIAQGIFDLDDYISALEIIANQCPYTGGTAVFRARNMLLGHTDAVFDDSNCGNDTQQFIGNIANENEELTTFRVFPNPTKDRVSVSFDIIGQDNLYQSIHLYNLHGELIREISINQESNTQQFYTGQLANGIYYLKVLDSNNNAAFSEKLIIIK